jgi:hypothetical protein
MALYDFSPVDDLPKGVDVLVPLVLVLEVCEGGTGGRGEGETKCNWIGDDTRRGGGGEAENGLVGRDA